MRIPLLIISVLALCVGVFVYMRHTEESSQDQRSRVLVGEVIVLADVASTPAARQLGLSGREFLPWGSGMVFLFPHEGKWGFWMKDMRFSIDIIWADSNGVITKILPSVSPTTYPHVFYPDVPAMYVLELPAGYAAAQHIGVGQKIVVQYNQRVE